ncbi:MAG: rod shape-determining protein MreD [Planctomycetes bacterium]|nr:rod shape-determining protein MreD [Planctomycetota bacterium]MCB9934311.1 rod shape-determining protein MreD [Planctomycetota bacterium]
MIQALQVRTQPPRYRWRIVAGGGLLLAAVHTLLLHRLKLGDFTPDLYSVFALYLGLFASRQGRYVPSLALGLIRDFFSLGLLGSYGVLYSLLHKAAGRARGKLDPERPLNVFIMALGGTFLVNFGYHSMLALSGEGIGWSRALARCASVAAASAPPAVLLYPVAHYLLHKLRVGRSGGYWNI